jgi:hypothetical protein
VSEGFNIEQASICMASDIFRIGKENPEAHLMIVCGKAKDAEGVDLTAYRIVPVTDEDVTRGIAFCEPWRNQLKAGNCAKVALVANNNSLAVHQEFYNSNLHTQQWFQYGLCRGVCLLFEIRADVAIVDQGAPAFFRITHTRKGEPYSGEDGS